MNGISFENISLKTAIQLSIGVIVLSVILSEPAYAAGLGGIESVLQKIVDVMTGNVARALGVIAVITTGVAWLFGYMDMRTAGSVVLGLVIIFSATEIVDLIAGGSR